MNRRRLLAGTGVLVFAGCFGGYSGSEPELASEGNDAVPIERSPEELLPSVDDFDDGWEERVADRDRCRAFSNEREDEEARLTTCAWVLEDVDAAEDAYESRVEESRFRTGRLQDDEPDVGVEAAVVDGGTEVDVIFRDANAVGRVEYDLSFDGRLREDQLPGPEDGIEYAVTMHRQWRE